MKKLGFGLMRLPLIDPNDLSKVDLEQVKKMADEFIKEGFTYFDTAYPYHKNGFSELAFRECVAKRYPRDAYTIADKLSLFMIDRKEDIPAFFESQLERCGVDYFDYYLLHAMRQELVEKAERMDAFSFVFEKKREGKIKQVGFSFHDSPEVLEKMLQAYPDIDFVQLQINYLDWEDPSVQSRRCYDLCVKYHKKVIVMEPVKGGLLSVVPEEAKNLLKEKEPERSTASWAIRFAASLDSVMVVLSGMSNLEQLEDNLSYMKEFAPLSKEEFELVFQVAKFIKEKETIPCTSCSYCVDGCPMNIPIPKYFALINLLSKFGESQREEAERRYQNALQRGYGKASDCIGCGQCESHCPQHIEIREMLKLVAKEFE